MINYTYVVYDVATTIMYNADCIPDNGAIYASERIAKSACDSARQTLGEHSSLDLRVAELSEFCRSIELWEEREDSYGNSVDARVNDP